MPRPEASTVRRWMLRVCVMLPLLMLAANLLAWLRWGFDLPFVDDWRAYADRTALSLAPGHLFKPVNNTISPVGFFLDVLAQRWLAGNAVPYQALSMLLVLGGLLALQWRLLKWALRGRTAALALSFLLTIFMLQSGTYWGEQNLAYHQALPLLALLAATWINFVARVRRGVRLGCVSVLGLLSGLSYISGAVAALVLGAAWMLQTRIGRNTAPADLARRSRAGGAVLAGVGLLTTGLQVGLTRTPGADPTGQSVRLTSPFNLDFWAYAAGKLGRATGQPFSPVGWELLWIALVALALLGAVVLALRMLRARVSLGCRAAWVFLPLLAVTVVYLGLVSLGRAGYRSPDIQGFDAVFLSGYQRFHYFWPTLLLPWVAAVGLLSRRGSTPARPGVERAYGARVLGFALIAILALAASRGVFDISSAYRKGAAFRSSQLHCLTQQVGAGWPIVCPGMDLIGISDWTASYLYAREIKASFVRYFPILAHDGWGPVLFDWDQPAARAEARWRDAGGPAGRMPQADAQPALALPLARAGDAPGDSAERCAVLGAQMWLDGAAPGSARLFYRPAGEREDPEIASMPRPVAPDAEGRAWLEFVVSSDRGFAPEVRLALPRGSKLPQILSLRVTCRLPVAVPRS